METKSEVRGAVYCPMCTHIVEAQVVMLPKTVHVKPGLKCPRCSSALDAGYVVHTREAVQNRVNHGQP